MPLQEFVMLFQRPAEEVEQEKRLACFMQRLEPLCKWGWEALDYGEYIVIAYRGDPVGYLLHGEICEDVVRALDVVALLIQNRTKDGSRH